MRTTLARDAHKCPVAGSPPPYRGLYMRWSSGDEEEEEEALIGKVRSRPASVELSSSRRRQRRSRGGGGFIRRKTELPLQLRQDMKHLLQALFLLEKRQ